MQLREIIKGLFEDSKRTPIRGLSAIAEAEKYLQQAYEGRYFFELIQNVRDANKEINQDGHIFINLKENILSISNTGAEFSHQGIEGITTIGRSTKHSQEYIGFKGIGFKSIQEVTNTPKIITRYGTIAFDRNLTIKEYADTKLEIEEVPLFYFPHFQPTKLSSAELNNEIVTKVELPLKEGILATKIVEDFEKIEAKQLVLLGNIEHLEFTSNIKNTQFSIHKNTEKHYLEVRKNETEIYNFKNYSPAHKIHIPQTVIGMLEGKEKEMFKNSSEIDVAVVLQLNERGQIDLIEDAKLYLFYPLQIASGFRFIIHSYFIVNPERTALRESPLNSFLLKEIGEFIGIEMLKTLKESKSNTTKILCFCRNEDGKLDDLYDSVVEHLKTQKFIYDTLTKRYFSVNEVIVADGFDKGLFRDGKLSGKRLIYLDDKKTINWLTDEFGIPYLTYEQIGEEIENECKRQLKNRKLKFFQNLYNYVSQHEQLNLMGKKVLLTDDWKLVSSDDDVFYGGGRKNPINLPTAIKKQIHFINQNIKISDFREGKSRTGISEFSTFELVRRLLKLFSKDAVSKADILNALYNLELDAKSVIEIKEKILLPIIGSNKWLSPITNPIYFPIENLKELYPKGNFVDETVLIAGSTIAGQSKAFLKKFGVWDIPAVYVNSNSSRISSNDTRESKLFHLSNLYSRPFYIINDRVLDKPQRFNYWFTNSIIEHYSIYRSFILSDFLPKMEYYSQNSFRKSIWEKEKFVELSDFVESLRTQKWIHFIGEENAYPAQEIIGIDAIEFHQPHNQVIKRYLKLLPINYSIKKEFLSTIEMKHLDGDSLENYVSLLNFIYHKYKNNVSQARDFVDFYNRILSKLFEYYFFKRNQVDNISVLSECYFLAVDDLKKISLWSKAKNIFYIDDKPGYDLLPLEVKQKVQPLFTNRDKNTFGKIASKIGRRFSDSIKRELIGSEFKKSTLLVTYFDKLAEWIAILESSLEIVFNKEIDVVKKVMVFEKEKITVRITVQGSDSLEMEVNHFVDNNLNLYLSSSFFENKNKLIAESMSDLFVKLIDRDLRRFNADLLRYLNTQDRKEYLRDYEISEERIKEIRDKLISSELSAVQKFWNAVLLAKDINTRENIFIGKNVNTNSLADHLKITPVDIEIFQSSFNFNDQSSFTNIDIITNLLKVLSLSLYRLNEFLYPKLDFRKHYEKLLLQVKNKFQKRFEMMLHNYLKSKGREDQELYQNIIDSYKYHFTISVPANTIAIDINDFFIRMLSVQYGFLEFLIDDLNKQLSDFNPNKIYKENFDILLSKLNSVHYTTEQLDKFLLGNKRRSLLYFKQIDFLTTAFTQWLKESEVQSSTTKEDALKDLLTEISNPSETKIETVSINKVDLPSPGKPGSNGTIGRRFDGAEFEKNKKIVGIVAEMIVFEKLQEKYKEVKWVSKNSSKIPQNHPGYNPEGDDILGYDIEYLDNDGNKYYVEVKGKSDNFDSFEISRGEVEMAHQAKEFYKVIFVTNTLNNSTRRIRDLGNLFLLEEGEDFFCNSKFSVLYPHFEIRFQ